MKDVNGFTLIELLVVLVIVTIMGAALLTLNQNQSRHNQILRGRLASQQAKLQLIAWVRNAENCTCHMRAGGRFNSRASSPSVSNLKLTIQDGCDNSAKVLFQKDQPLPDAPEIVVANIAFTDIVMTGAEQYMGIWELTLRDTRTGLTLRPVQVSQFVYTQASPPTAKEIKTCSVGELPGGHLCGWSICAEAGCGNGPDRVAMYCQGRNPRESCPSQFVQLPLATGPGPGDEAWTCTAP